jgi:Flp pilus assembly protein TadG
MQRADGRRPAADEPGSGERGQALILSVLVITIIFFVGAITVDVGIHLVEKRGMQRAADFASLSGSLELPADPAKAREVALEWAARNGYEHGVNGVQVEVQMLCSNNLAAAPSGVCKNQTPGAVSTCTPEVGCDSMRVLISQPGVSLFADIFGVGGVAIASGAAAKLSFNIAPLESILLLDDTGSMVLGCNSSRTNPGCPIKESKSAAHKYVDAITGANNTSKVGYAAYRGCYNPPRSHSGCIAESTVRDLTANASSLHSAIDLANGVGGSRTNVCVALHQARAMLNGPNSQGPGVRRTIVILTDGDNNYSSNTYDQGQNSPPTSCRPSNPSQSDPDTTCTGGSSEARERQMDSMTHALSQDLRTSANVEIFVVGFGVCGSGDPKVTPNNGYCGGIGNGATDSVADRRLLKCMASSTPGTNDHYFEVPTAQDLPAIFQTIAFTIAGRALSE